MIFIFKIPPNWVCVDSYREPMQADISPIFCIAFTMFFFIDIILLPPKIECVMLLLAAHAVQHFAVLGHGLNQILSKSVLHNINTSKIAWVMFEIWLLGAMCRSTKRGGIIAPLFWFRKAWNWLVIGRFWLLWRENEGNFDRLRIKYEHFMMYLSLLFTFRGSKAKM